MASRLDRAGSSRKLALLQDPAGGNRFEFKQNSHRIKTR